MIDLRSDTVTKPTAGMRHAMANADVGDDVWGEDPTVQHLEARVAELLGKEAALFVPSGTMANQIALLLHTHPGDEVILGAGCHVMNFESGAGAALAGVQFRELGTQGWITSDDVVQALRPHDIHYPIAKLVWIENSHNRSGGRIVPQSIVDGVMTTARHHGLATHLDGARLLNVAVAQKAAPSTLVKLADTASLCLSKGLGAPMGSVIAASRSHIQQARRFRKRLGGGMRQVGIVAAAGLYALDHHVERLVEDHQNAARLASRLAEFPQIEIQPELVETNIVVFSLREAAPDIATILARCRERGVLFSAFGARRIRAVTHLDVTQNDCDRAIHVLAEVLAND